MNDDVLEGLLRSGLRALAPSEVPHSLVERATAIPEGIGRPRKPAAPRRVLRVGLAFALGMVVLSGAATLVSRLGDRSVAAPSIPPLPAADQPPLPPGAPNPTEITNGAWVSPTTAWLVDADHALHMTEDGGQTWSGARPLPHDDLRGDPVFLDASFGYAMWARPDSDPVDIVVYLTRDGGRSWEPTAVGTLPKTDSNSLTAHFTDPRHGIVLAGAYRQEPVAPRDTAPGLRQVACAGWLTDDGGATWAALPGAPCSDHDDWATPTVGTIWPVSDGGPRLVTTTDGGRTWREGLLPGVTPDDFPYVALFTVGPKGEPRVGYYVITRGDPSENRTLVVAETGDGGSTWDESYQAPATGLGTISPLGPDHWLSSGPAAGGPGALPRPILETADGGRTWVAVGNLGTIDGAPIGWFDRLHGMATGQDESGCSTPSGTPCHIDGFYLTNDGAASWHGVPF